MNKVDQDCGTTFAWVTRALGPYAGLDRWAGRSSPPGVLVIGSLADVLRLLHVRPARARRAQARPHGRRHLRGCDRRGDDDDLRDRHRALGQGPAGDGAGSGRRADPVHRRRRLPADHRRHPEEGDRSPRCRGSNPFAVKEYSGLLSGVLLGVFIYWGWESAVNLTEESRDSSARAGTGGHRQHVAVASRSTSASRSRSSPTPGLDRIGRFDDNAGGSSARSPRTCSVRWRSSSSSR